MKPHCYFVTGTDTEVGKTFISCAILQQANQQGLTTAAYKPVAAGCELCAEGLRNEDALLLQQASSLSLSYDKINPVALAPAVAPHLAALKADVSLSLDRITSGYQHLVSKRADLTLVEGAGGWRLPLDKNYYLSDFVIEQRLGVILVVGIRLGCLNHALLTAEAINHDGLKLVGWVANQLDMSMPYRQENIDDLKSRIDAPFFGQVPQVETPEHAAQHIDLSSLLA